MFLKKMIPPSYNEQSGITTRGTRASLLSLTCCWALALARRRKSRTWAQRVMGKRVIKS
jgi:hypothetical protein